MGATWGQFHKLFCALHITFEKLFRGVERALGRAPNFIRAISDLRLGPIFYEINPCSELEHPDLSKSKHLAASLNTYAVVPFSNGLDHS